MLGRLFGRDARALSRVLVPLHAAVAFAALVGVAAALALFAAQEHRLSTWALQGGASEGYAQESDCGEYRNASRVLGGPAKAALDAAEAVASLSVLLSCAAAVAAPPATLAAAARRFRRDLLVQEDGSPPAPPAAGWQHAASKLLAGALWLGASLVVAFACLSAVSAAAVGFSDVGPTDLLPVWMLRAAGGAAHGEGWLHLAIGAANLALGAVEALSACYAALATGAAMASRRKVAAALVPAAAILSASATVKLLLGLAAWGPALGLGGDAGELLMAAAGWTGSAAVAGACFALCSAMVSRGEPSPGGGWKGGEA